jgi:hypothetical protein
VWVHEEFVIFLVAHLMMLSVLRLHSVNDRMINEYGKVSGMKIGGVDQSIQKSCPGTTHQKSCMT